MGKKASNLSWLFICYIASERRFIVHVIAVPSFFKALTEHAAIFPSHSVVFSLQVPSHLSVYIGRQLQNLFLDSEPIYAEFARCINAPLNSLVVDQIKTYQGLIPLSYSDSSRRFSLSLWHGEYYESAQAFVLHASLIEFFNSIFFVSDNMNASNLFKI